MFDGWLRLYDWTLRLTLRFRAVTMVVSVALLVGTVYLFMIVPKGFLPSEDQGRFNVSAEAAQGIGFDDMVRHQMEVADIVAKDPNVFGYTSKVGGGRRRRAQPGRVNVDLKPRDERNAVGRPGHRRSCGRSWRRSPACARTW